MCQAVPLLLLLPAASGCSRHLEPGTHLLQLLLVWLLLGGVARLA
jgi:hypothetical protein